MKLFRSKKETDDVRDNHCRLGRDQGRLVWSKEKRRETKSSKMMKLTATNDSPIRAEGDATLELFRDSDRCHTKFLDTDVQRLETSMSSDVEEGNSVGIGPSVHRENEQ